MSSDLKLVCRNILSFFPQLYALIFKVTVAKYIIIALYYQTLDFYPK